MYAGDLVGPNEVHLASISEPGDGSWNDPIIVRRDNPAVGGQFEAFKQVRANVSSPYLSDGTWDRVRGWFEIEEIREHHFPFSVQSMPILPTAPVDRAGLINYGTRAGVMVHGNTYGVTMRGMVRGYPIVADDIFQLLRPVTYFKLADDVLVVPVMVVSWYDMNDPDGTLHDETELALKMFDFNPIFNDNQYQPKPYLRASDNTWVAAKPLFVYNPYHAVNDSPGPEMAPGPDFEEIPPDEIWQQCGIQFQVVKQTVAALPRHKVANHCDTLASNVGNLDLVKAWGILDPSLLAYFMELDPIVVSYVDFAPCPFYGTTPGGGHGGFHRDVEVAYRRPRNITSHELGHALGLDHLVAEGNLMTPGPSTETKLTKAQCTAARAVAQAASDRYDHYNWVTGRTYSDQVPPPPPGLPAEEGPIDIGDNSVCCLGATDVSWTTGSCDQEVADGLCEVVCCSVTPGSKVTAYRCDEAGGVPVSCPPAA